MMDPIEGWNFVFYIGNLFADTAIAAFAIKSGYFDKKYDAAEQRLKEIRKEEMAKRHDIREVVGEVYLKVGYITEGGRAFDENYFFGNLYDLKPLYQLLESIGEENAKKVRNALIDEFSEDHTGRLRTGDTTENVLRPLHKIVIVRELYSHTLKHTLDIIDKSINFVDKDLQNLDTKRTKINKYFSDIIIIGFFLFGIAFQITSLFASGWITFFPFQLRIFILALGPAIILLAILRLLAEIEWV